MKKQNLNEQVDRIKSMMKFINESDFINLKKVRRFRPSNVSREIEIETEDDYLYPVFDAYVKCEPGDFYYEYGDIRGTHNPGMECYAEDIDWNRKDFSEEENAIIERYLNENGEKIEEKLIDNFEPSEPEPDYDYD